MKDNQDLVSVTAFLSALVHAAIILGVSFKLPDIAQSSTDNTLDVVLLNMNNDESPQEAELVSTSDNSGGGDDEREGSTQRNYELVEPSPIDSVLKVAQQQTKSTLSPDQLITAQQGEISIARIAPDQSKLKSPDNLVGEDILTTRALRKLERERLIAKISQTQEDYNKRPNKKFLSPTTKAHGAAKYLDQWSKSVTRNGNANFPVQVKAEKLSGMLIVSVEINPNGTIADLKIISPSPHKLLNDSALRIIRSASPFAAFPDDAYFKGTDILVMTRSIHFLADNRIISTAAPR